MNDLTDSELDEKLHQAFNVNLSTLHQSVAFKQRINVQHASLTTQEERAYEQLLSNAQLRKMLSDYLSFADFTILRIAYQHDTAPTDITLVMADILPLLSHRVDHSYTTITGQFATMAILSELKRRNLFAPAMKQAGVQDVMLRKKLYQVFNRYRRVTALAVDQAKQRARHALQPEQRTLHPYEEEIAMGKRP